MRPLSSHLSTVDRRGAGFTFPDLLLVLAGIAVLIAVATPIIRTNLSSSRRLRCTANLKQITHAMQQYADENAGTLPSETTRQSGIWWWYKENVKGYLGIKTPSSPSDKTIFGCPDDRGYDEPGPFWSNAKFDYGSYNFNGVTVPGVPSIAGHTIASIKEPNRTLLMMEWTAHAPLSWHHSLTGSKNQPFYNNAESVVGFVDGHVDFIKIYYDGMNPAYTRDPVSGYAYRYSGGD